VCWRCVSGGFVDGALKGVGAGVGSERAENSGGDGDDDGDEDEDDHGAEHRSGTAGKVGEVRESMGSKWYRYGGMWKNKHEASSAKMPRRVKREMKEKRQAGNAEPKDAEVGHADREILPEQNENLEGGSRGGSGLQLL